MSKLISNSCLSLRNLALLTSFKIKDIFTTSSIKAMVNFNVLCATMKHSIWSWLWQTCHSRWLWQMLALAANL